MERDLKQCPHNKAVQCIMEDLCEGCEVYAEAHQEKFPFMNEEPKGEEAYGVN